MKTRNFQSPLLAAGIVAALTLAVGIAPAQDSTKAQNPGMSQAAPKLSDVVSQVIQLSKANVGEGTIITFIQNSGNNHTLDAAQIIYLNQQGVSPDVVNAMIKQFNWPGNGTPVANPPVFQASYASYTIAQSPKAAANSPNLQTNYVMIPPATTPVQIAPAYYYPYPPPYYPYYYGYGWPPVSLSFGFGWRGGGWHGGYHH